MVFAVACCGPVGALPADGGALERELGRSEDRVRSAPFAPWEGATVRGLALPERLTQLGYRRVHARPRAPGEYFWGHEVFWIHRRSHRWAGRERRALLFGLRLRRADGRVLGAVDAEENALVLEPDPSPRGTAELWLEPRTLAESLDGDRAPRVLLELADLPDRVWRPVLAAEDARFFEHGGVDARALARAAWVNLRSGGVAQGGSTITQQLVKNRDLTPRRTLGRKASEALRALALEADHDKEEILEAYLNSVYLGHVEGLAVHGFGAAARVYFGRDAAELSLAEAATLAAVIQGPNRLSPLRHPEAARRRRDAVLQRMLDLDWASPADVAAARASAVTVRPRPPRAPPARQFVAWASGIARDHAPRRAARGRGLVVETTLDPWLQELAESVVGDWLATLRRRHARLRDRPLHGVLVAVDARSGAVLAHVGGDPEGGGTAFDRARRARRQPGSAVKPFVVLEAFDDCDGRPLHPASRVADEPLEWVLPSGAWRPANADGRFHGLVDVRRTLVDSLNVPAVRIARHCGLEGTRDAFVRAGLPVPADPPPSFALGSVELTPLELARAYTTFATPGRTWRLLPVTRVERPGGRRLWRARPSSSRVASPGAAWLVRDILRDAVRRGTARGVDIPGLDVAAKTGTSSGGRDAWLAGQAGSLVVVTWIGLDDGRPLRLSGAEAAAPPWRSFVARAAPLRPPLHVTRPRDVVAAHVDPTTGLRVRAARRGAREEFFLDRSLPRRDRFWRRDEPEPVVR